MTISYITLFNSLVEFYFRDSILKRALDSGLFTTKFINPRDFSKDRHKKVDDYMVGGGAGLLMKPEPLYEAIKRCKEQGAYIIYPTPAGKPFRQNDAKRLAKKEHICFVCGRYEGIDERIVEQCVDELFSIGDFIITGGELGALCMSDAICRNIKGVLGNEESLKEESFEELLLEAPSFVKPTIFNDNPLPSELLKGNHGKIQALKNQMASLKTSYYRPDLANIANIKENYEK